MYHKRKKEGKSESDRKREKLDKLRSKIPLYSFKRES